MKCLKCNQHTNNPKFCNHSCAATYNNKIPKRKRKIRRCKHCNSTDLPTPRATACFKCNPRFRDWSTTTLASLLSECTNQHQRVRQHARRLYDKSNLPKMCWNCKYDRCYEVAHRKPVSEFPPETMVIQVNRLSNLYAFCRNCHWEFDHHLWRRPKYNLAANPL